MSAEIVGYKNSVRHCTCIWCRRALLFRSRLRCCDRPYSVSSDVSQYFGTCGCDSSPLTHDEGPAVYSVGPAPFPSSLASLSAPFSCPGFIRIWHLPGRHRNRNLAFHSHLQMRPLLLSHLHTLTLSVYTHLGPLSTCSVPLKTQFKCQSEPWN